MPSSWGKASEYGPSLFHLFSLLLLLHLCIQWNLPQWTLQKENNLCRADKLNAPKWFPYIANRSLPPKATTYLRKQLHEAFNKFPQLLAVCFLPIESINARDFQNHKQLLDLQLVTSTKPLLTSCLRNILWVYQGSKYSQLYSGLGCICPHISYEADNPTWLSDLSPSCVVQEVAY